jgi:hypothetical protein
MSWFPIKMEAKAAASHMSPPLRFDLHSLRDPTRPPKQVSRRLLLGPWMQLHDSD